MNSKKRLVFLSIFLCLSVLMTAVDKKEQAEALYEQGNRNLEAGNFAEAIRDYTRAIELNPTLAKAYSNRGLAKYNLEDYPAAIQDFDKAIELEPTTDAYYNRGLARHYFYDYSSAVQDFSKVIAMDPEDKDAYYMRGLSKTYVEGMDIKSACEDFQKAKDLGHTEAANALITHCSEEGGTI